MDDQESDDSLIDDLLSAIEQNTDQNICVLRGDPVQTIRIKRTEEERLEEVVPQDLLQGAVTDISSSQDADSSEKEVKKDEHTPENLSPLNNDAVLVIEENVNIGDLFKSNIELEFIYCAEPIGDIRNENKEDYGEKFSENSLVEVVVEDNGTVGQIEREQILVHAGIQQEEEDDDLAGRPNIIDTAIEYSKEENSLFDDRAMEYYGEEISSFEVTVENNEAVSQREREPYSVQAAIQEKDDVEGDRADEFMENNIDENSLVEVTVVNNEAVVGQIERENYSVQAAIQEKDDVEGDRADEFMENNIDENSLVEVTVVNNEAVVGQIERENYSVQADMHEEENYVEGDRTNEAMENNKEENIEINNNSRISRKEAQISRVRGAMYVGYGKDENNVLQKVSREGRKMKERCSHKELTKKNKLSFLCGDVTEIDRQREFDYFWGLETWAEKKCYVRGLVSSIDIRRRRKETLLSMTEHNEDDDDGDEEEEPVSRKRMRKNCGKIIHFPKDDGERIRVCRTFLINTLAIGEDSYKRWVKRGNEVDEQVDNNINVSNQIPPRKKKKLDDVSSIKDWLSLLPKVPSHYCRKSSSKIYVESVFRSISNMFCTYKKWCQEEDRPAASITLFKIILKEEKISIHAPRKDQCDVCCGHKLGSISDEIYQTHLKRKDDARKEKNIAKELARNSDGDFLVITMDLQSVLLAPKTLASAMYYKQKLQVHNFTIYELNNGDVTLYVWHEGHGGVSANEFTSCIIDFLQNKTSKRVMLISDGCNAQNRNKVLASALHDFCISKNIEIEQLFLQKGHTMMEADSVHATLEQCFTPPINSPMDYIARMRQARPKQPYNVKVLNYEFFKNFEGQESNLVSLRPGRRSGDPVVTNICRLKFNPDGKIHYKIQFEQEWEILPQRRTAAAAAVPLQHLKPLYKEPLKINESKFRDLQSLKNMIEKDHHFFYDSLPYKPDKNRKK